MTASPSDPVIIVGGGQSGLAAARAALEAGLRPVVLEAEDRPVGSWPHYYDSLSLFSPVRFSHLPGGPMPGDPDHYPTRNEVTDYLARYAATLDAEIRTNTRVTAVTAEGAGFVVHTESGDSLPASGVIAASGSFANPYVPRLPGQQDFTGELLHVAEYRRPEPYAGKRVLVVGAGNSAVQVAYEIAQVAPTTLATRNPIHFWTQQVDGLDLHYRLESSGFDRLPPQWLARLITFRPVLDTGKYRASMESGLLDRRAMFTGFTHNAVIWPDGSHEQVDVVMFATGYLPSLEYLRPLGALDPDSAPLHQGGLSTTHVGLAYVGLEFQRSFASNTLRGVYRDAEHVVAPLAASAKGAWDGIATAHGGPGPLAA